MKRDAVIIAITLIILFATGLHAGPFTMSATSYMSYNPDTELNDLRQSIIYQFPDSRKFGPGPYPLFIWTAGTLESHKDALAITFVNQMAARGFVAASVQYSNVSALDQTCSGYNKRTQGVFDSLRPTSAIGVLCSMRGVKCSKGVVTSGVSQGGILAILAANYAPVRAVFAMSVSDRNRVTFGFDVDLGSCLDKGVTAIPSNRLMIVNGEDDLFFGGQEPLQNVSGYVCPEGSHQCWSPEGNGAGWYIVQNWQTTDGDADHCYMLTTGCGYSTPEANWIHPSTFNWSFKPNLDWLATLGTFRVFSPTGQ